MIYIPTLYTVVHSSGPSEPSLLNSSMSPAAAQGEQQMQQNIDADVEGVQCCCCTCGQEVEAKAAVLVRDIGGSHLEKLWRCRLCHNAIGRVRTILMKLNEDQQLGFRNMTPEERREFYKKAQTQCGANLQKQLTESIITSTLNKITDQTLEDGIFRPIEEVEEEWKKKPEKLAQLKLNAPRVKCKYTGEELIMIPSYSYKHCLESEESSESKRRLQSEQCVKKMKVTTEGATQKKTPAKKPSDNKADIPKPITDAQQKRLKKCLSDLERNKLKYADLCLHIDTNNAHESISERLMKRITDLSGNLDALIERTKNALSQNSISSNGFKDLSEAIKDTSPPLLELMNNARASVDLFGSGESSAATD